MNFDERKVSVLGKGVGWIAVYKPSGISIHNEKRDLLFYVQRIVEDEKLKEIIGFDESFGLNPVHRLDMDTSGIVILACRKESFRQISSQFENHTVEKRYTAVVHGFIEEKGWQSWNKKLSKQAGGRKNIPGNGRKVACETKYLVKKNSEHYTLLEIDLNTGRKHQIRKHSALSGHPVVFDERYGSKRAVKFLMEKYPEIRLCLHCYFISFETEDGEKKIIEIINQPQSFSNLLKGDI